jgi:hypothetical protein
VRAPIRPCFYGSPCDGDSDGVSNSCVRRVFARDRDRGNASCNLRHPDRDQRLLDGNPGPDGGDARAGGANSDSQPCPTADGDASLGRVPDAPADGPRRASPDGDACHPGAGRHAWPVADGRSNPDSLPDTGADATSRFDPDRNRNAQRHANQDIDSDTVENGDADRVTHGRRFTNCDGGSRPASADLLPNPDADRGARASGHSYAAHLLVEICDHGPFP